MWNDHRNVMSDDWTYPRNAFLDFAVLGTKLITLFLFFFCSTVTRRLWRYRMETGTGTRTVDAAHETDSVEWPSPQGLSFTGNTPYMTMIGREAADPRGILRYLPILVNAPWRFCFIPQEPHNSFGLLGYVQYVRKTNWPSNNWNSKICQRFFQVVLWWSLQL